MQDYGQEDTDELIALLSRYKSETGKEYSSDYHAIKNGLPTSFAKKDKEKRMPKAALCAIFALKISPNARGDMGLVKVYQKLSHKTVEKPQ